MDGAGPVICEPAEWKRRAVLHGCAATGGLLGPCEGPIQGHHPLSQQALRKRGLQDLLWDDRNSMGLCYRHHRRHDNRTQVLPRALLQDSAWEFAREVGLDWMLEKRYLP